MSRAVAGSFTHCSSFYLQQQLYCVCLSTNWNNRNFNAHKKQASLHFIAEHRSDTAVTLQLLPLTISLYAGKPMFLTVLSLIFFCSHGVCKRSNQILVQQVLQDFTVFVRLLKTLRHSSEEEQLNDNIFSHTSSVVQTITLAHMTISQQLLNRLL